MSEAAARTATEARDPLAGFRRPAAAFRVRVSDAAAERRSTPTWLDRVHRAGRRASHQRRPQATARTKSCRAPAAPLPPADQLRPRVAEPQRGAPSRVREQRLPEADGPRSHLANPHRPGAQGPDGRVRRDVPVRRRCRAKKGGVYHVDGRPARLFTTGRVFNTHPRRDDDPRPRHGHGAQRHACPSPRSSISPTCTTPSTRSAARLASLQFFSQGQLSPTRWSCASPAYAYQKGFGGHFHNDNSLGAYCAIFPGLDHRLPRRKRCRRRPDAARHACASPREEQRQGRASSSSPSRST